jgi:activator of 2-hydroxyglutaryl-CoA dehydratase
VEQASALCENVTDPAPLSGRCPVILKTDMTHLANKGEDRHRILAGLFDAVCDNVLTLIRPGISPKRCVLTGGVTRSQRIRRTLHDRLSAMGFTLMPASENAFYLQAVGCALMSSDQTARIPEMDALILPAQRITLERLPSLAASLKRVRRMSVPEVKLNGEVRRLCLGFDIGSTGSKAVALDLNSREVVWESYRQTLGQPVASAQGLFESFTSGPAGKYQVLGFGVTGSGREIVGSL